MPLLWLTLPRRELLGLKVGDSENEAFWAEFITSLRERGLGGVKLVISDAHVLSLIHI